MILAPYVTWHYGRALCLPEWCWKEKFKRGWHGCFNTRQFGV